jgi:hypothetical protein
MPALPGRKRRRQARQPYLRGGRARRTGDGRRSARVRAPRQSRHRPRAPTPRRRPVSGGGGPRRRVLAVSLRARLQGGDRRDAVRIHPAAPDREGGRGATEPSPAEGARHRAGPRLRLGGHLRAGVPRALRDDGDPVARRRLSALERAPAGQAQSGQTAPHAAQSTARGAGSCWPPASPGGGHGRTRPRSPAVPCGVHALRGPLRRSRDPRAVGTAPEVDRRPRVRPRRPAHDRRRPRRSEHHSARAVSLRCRCGGRCRCPGRWAGRHRGPAGRPLRPQRIRGHRSRHPGRLGSRVQAWLPTSGYQPDDRPCVELYHGDPTVDARTRTFRCELGLPVRPL